MARKEYRSKRQRNQSRKWVSGGLFFGGVILVLAAISLFFGPREVQANVSYQETDVVYGKGYLAVHEMSGPSLDQIPFLPKDDPQPQIALSESVYDFGKIGATDIVTHEFVIKNTGEGTLIISRAYTTCGCTTAEFTTMEIPPGKVAIMTLTYDAGFHDARGQTVRRGVIIENNDPTMPEIEIWAEAYVLNE